MNRFDVWLLLLYMNRSKGHCHENCCQGTVREVMLHVCIDKWHSDVRSPSKDALNRHIFICRLTVTDEHIDEEKFDSQLYKSNSSLIVIFS